MPNYAKIYIALEDTKILGVWTNLKKLCLGMKAMDNNFPSYQKIVRLKIKDTYLVETDEGKKYKIVVRIPE